MQPLYEDMELDSIAVGRVADYLADTGFHLPGATPADFTIHPRAVYLGFFFLSEDLESYGVPLTCTAGPRTGARTFIRMSRGQLLGERGAKILPVNDPVEGSDILPTKEYRATAHDETPTGVDSYADEGEVPGFDMDMRMLELTLERVAAHATSGKGRDVETFWELSVNWGVLMAGRYPRLVYLRSKLSPSQERRLTLFEREAARLAPELHALGLIDPTQATVPVN